MNATLLPPESPAETSAPKRRARPRCEHCGAPVTGTERFCCGGCAFVSRLIRDEGLEAYYDIKDAVTAPAESALSPARDFAWLADAARAAEAGAAENGRAAELELAVQGLSCAACVWLVERLFRRREGAGEIEVSAETGRLRMRWHAGRFDAADFARELQRFNYLLGPADAARAGEPESRGLARKTGLAGALAMNAMLFTLPYYFGMSEKFEYARLFETLALGFATLSVLGCGSYFLTRAAAAMRAKLVHLDLPIALGITGAFAGSVWGWAIGDPECQYFDFVTGFIFLMLLGRWAQVAAVERNQRRLLREQPEAARVLAWRGEDEAAWTEAAPETLQAGETFAIGAGAMVPVEARLASDEAEFSLAWITGEAEPRLFRAGQRVPAGASLAGRSSVELVATQAWEGSLLAELTRPVERAPERARLIERVVKWYLAGIIGTAVLAGLWWGWRTGDAGRTGAVVISILVVSCPCALGLAFPLTEELATVRLRRRGVFLRAGDLWQRLARVRTAVFDKTGTLTRETPELRDPAALERLTAEERSALLALVRDNPHPVGRALHEALLLRGWRDAPAVGEVVEEVGRGVRLGPWGLVRATEGGADTVLTWGGQVVARFAFTDAVRADAREELAALARRGLGLAVLSGDRCEKVSALAAGLGVRADWARGELSPREKADWLAAHGGDTALMLGDGANDSLAFDRALCRGTPAVHRGTLATKADFYYLGRGIGGVRALLEVNDARRATQAALLVFMIAYNLTAVGLAATGQMNPLFAAVLMPLSSLATLAIVWMGLRRARNDE